MSTFNGIVSEFPLIRIDFFRTKPFQPPPLACFLSHIHSDHLQGLESLKSPFIYCSAATRRLLLRLEKYPHRMNFAKGVLESRKQHYAHLKNLLKAIPLHTPTEIELGANDKMQVTLFDANHCPGAVMFLIQGSGKAVLYSGDIRAEPWWVESLIRNPVLIPYTLGKKRLDCLYLDTTFATKEDVYRDFPSKSIGIHELLQKVDRYPPETIFYLRAWTLGYEDVWIALSAAIASPIHVDNYQSNLYRFLADNRPDGISVPDAAFLVGFQFGNHFQSGCLTKDPNVRIHSCEPGTACHGKLSKNGGVVWITPIITRSKDGVNVQELGAGGGYGDLNQYPELDVADTASMQALEELCKKFIKDPTKLSQTLDQLSSAQNSRSLRMSLDDLGLNLDTEIPLEQFVKLMGKKDVSDTNTRKGCNTGTGGNANENALPDTIHFPYSRHSSYNELCHLVSAFRPMDIYACTVDEETWSEEVSMEALFGHLCSNNCFKHDQEIKAAVQGRNTNENLVNSRKRKRGQNEETQQSDLSQELYETAHGSVFELVGTKEQTDRPSCVSPISKDPELHTPHGSVNLRTALKTDQQNPTSVALCAPNTHLKAIRTAFRAMNDGKDTISPPPTSSIHPDRQLTRKPRKSGQMDSDAAPEFDPLPSSPDEHASGLLRLNNITSEQEDLQVVARPSPARDLGPPGNKKTEQHIFHAKTLVNGRVGISTTPLARHMSTTTTTIEERIEHNDTNPTSTNIDQLSVPTSAFDSHSQSPQPFSSDGVFSLQLDGSLDLCSPPPRPPPNQKPFVTTTTTVHAAAKIPSLATPFTTTRKAKEATFLPLLENHLRHLARKEAYKAARMCLETSHSGVWDDLIGLRCMGRSGHVEEEVEL